MVDDKPAKLKFPVFENRMRPSQGSEYKVFIVATDVESGKAAEKRL